MKVKFTEIYTSYYMDEAETFHNNYEWELLSITDSFWNWKQAHILCEDWKVRSVSLSDVKFIK